MKKFIALTVALGAALVAQSAQVEWSSGGLGTAIANQGDITGVTAYYYVIDKDTASAYDSLTQSELYYTYFNEDGTQREGAASPNETVAANAFGVANWTQNDATPDSENNTAYVVAIYQARSEFGGTYALASVASATFDPDSLEGFDDPVSGNFSGIGTSAYAANGGGSWAAVPEPTTVALLALGLAAVGMKRKVA